jgi:hypothetical protein
MICHSPCLSYTKSKIRVYNEPERDFGFSICEQIKREYISVLFKEMETL